MMLVWGFRKRAKNSSCAHDQCRTSIMNCQCFSSSPSNKDKNEINNEINEHSSEKESLYNCMCVHSTAHIVQILVIIYDTNTIERL
uniref:Uncharacterized protein n=1 Tax=Glossina palpalis gambiensis TaxID=67801 RepID=A0A1B0BPW8_9MUSC